MAANPQDPRALALRRDDEAELGNNAAALRDYDAAILADPSYQYAYVTRCETRLVTHNVAGALADCNEGVKLNAQDGLAFEDRGDVYFDQSNYPAALSDYSRAIALGRNEAYVFGARCDAERLVGQRAPAAADCGKGLRIDPKSRRALWANARLATTGGNYAAAIGYLNTYIHQRPAQSDTAYYYRGLAYNRSHNFRAALSDLQFYVKRAPSDPDGYYERAIARFGSGDRNGAIADLTTALSGYRKAADTASAARAAAELAAVRARRSPKL